MLSTDDVLERVILEIVKKCGSKWCLYTKSKKGGKRRRLGTHPSKEKAYAQERAIKANESVIDARSRFASRRKDAFSDKLSNLQSDVQDAFALQDKNEKIVSETMEDVKNEIDKIVGQKRMRMAIPELFSDDEWSSDAHVFDVVSTTYDGAAFHDEIANYVRSMSDRFSAAAKFMKEELEELPKDFDSMKWPAPWRRYTGWGSFAFAASRFIEKIEKMLASRKANECSINENVDNVWVVRQGARVLVKPRGQTGGWKEIVLDKVTYFTKGELRGGPRSRADSQYWTFSKGDHVYTIREVDIVSAPEWGYGSKQKAKKVKESRQLDDVEQRWIEQSNLPQFKPFIDAIKNAVDPKELARAKRAIEKHNDQAIDDYIPDGMWNFFYDERKKQLRTSMGTSTKDDPKAARLDRILRIRDSSGKAKSRR